MRDGGQEVMDGLGLGWKGTKVVLNELGTKAVGFQVGFWGHTVMVGLRGWVGRAPKWPSMSWGPKLWG